MIKYYKLFDLLNRKGMKKTDLLKIISSKTLAKISKGESLSGEVIEKICNFMHCQPGDIMEFIIEEQLDENTIMTTVPQVNHNDYVSFRPITEEPHNDYRLGMEYISQMKKNKEYED